MKDLEAYLAVQKGWSAIVFGEGPRVEGICKHIESELKEVRANPSDVTEWVDIVILALDGAWRAGYSPAEVCEALHAKQNINLDRQWKPITSDGEPIFHIRDPKENKPLSESQQILNDCPYTACKGKNLQAELATAKAENKRLRDSQMKKDLCIIDLAKGVFRLWHAVADGTYDSRSVVGDTALAMQESLVDIGIDVRNAPLDITALQENKP